MTRAVAILLCFFPGAAFGAITNVRVIGTTNTQAVISYTAPNSSGCTIDGSESPSYAPAVNAVNTALFPGSNSDGGGALNRTFVLGQRTTRAGSDGRLYSLALRTTTQHFFRITCGSDQATGTFVTANIPLGSTRSDALPVDPNRPGKLLWPDNPPNGRIIDPETGVLLSRVSKKNAWLVRGNGWDTNGYPVAAADPAPSGSNWTNPGAVTADDSNYAAYSGTGQDWLFAGTGGAYPAGDGDGSTELSYQSLLIKAKCTSGNCASGTEMLQVAVTTDGKTPMLPLVDVPISSTETTIQVCADAPCSTPDNPGDTITFQNLRKYATAYGSGRVWNDAANARKIFFTDITDCNMLYNGETLTIAGDGANAAPDVPVISNKNCAASPPQFDIDRSVSYLSMNGTLGIPFGYPAGISGNKRYGFLVRKKSTNSNAVISLNYLKFKMMAYATQPGGANPTSAGNHKICSNKPSANGYYHCALGQEIYGIKPAADGSADVRFMGVAYYQGGGTIASGAMLYCIGSNGGGDWLWDDRDPNLMYCNGQSAQVNPATGQYDGRAILVKVKYTGNDLECGSPGALCSASDPYGDETKRAPKLPQEAAVNLTPCLNGCTVASDDESFAAQITRFTQGKTYQFSATSFGACGVDAIQDKHAIINCRNGQQDSYAWMAVLDLDTQRVIAANPTFARFNGTWATIHTYSTNGPVPVAQADMQTDKDRRFQSQLDAPLSACVRGSTCDPCPNVTLLQNGVNYSGLKLCSTMSVTSAWNPGWGTAPAGYSPGEFVSDISNLRFLKATAPGDAFLVYNPGEYVRLVQKISSSQWIVERGAASDDRLCHTGGFNVPSAHGTGEAVATVWAFRCDPTVGYSMAWYFLDDPDGADPNSYFYTEYSNHSTSRGNIRIAPFYKVSFADPILEKSRYRSESDLSAGVYTYIGTPNSFSGAYQFAQPNAVENHPAYGQVDAAPQNRDWFLDLNPLLFYANTVSPNDTTKVGKYVYRYNAAIHDIFDERFKPKLYDIGAFCGDTPLLNVSGPGRPTLQDSTADSYKVCAAVKGGECWPSSQPGEVYLNCPTAWEGLQRCKGVEFYNGFRDICAGNFSGISGAYTQWMIPAKGNAPNFSTGRIFSRVWNRYRQGATANVKTTPDGRFALLQSEFAATLPPRVDRDGIDRSEYIPVIVKVKPPAGLGITNAYVEFGYTPGFYCMSRTERCIANSTTIDRTNPFVWPSEYASESAIAGVPCSGGCSIPVPTVSQRVLYYRIKYRDTSNTEVSSSDTYVATTP